MIKRRQTISHNTWLHRLVAIGVRPLAKTPVTPNQITTLRLVTGLIAAACFAIGAELYSAIGSGIFVLSLLLDRADGILARLTGNISTLGHKYDLIADTLCNSFAFIGVGIGLRSGVLGETAILLGIIAGLAVTAILWLVMQAEKKGGDGAAELESSMGFDPDDAMLIVPIAIFLDFHTELIVAAAFVSPLFSIFFFFKFRRFLGD